MPLIPASWGRFELKASLVYTVSWGGLYRKGFSHKGSVAGSEKEKNCDVWTRKQGGRRPRTWESVQDSDFYNWDTILKNKDINYLMRATY